MFRKCKPKMQKLFHNTAWERIAFPSTNGALNLRKSLIEDVLVARGYHD